MLKFVNACRQRVNIMAIITSAKGLIVTGGLGGPACCALLTAPFSLVCGCVLITVSPPGTGGWAQYPVTNIPGVPPGSAYYTPAPKRYGQEMRYIMLTVKWSEREWIRRYLVQKDTADILVSVVGAFNNITVTVKGLFHATGSNVQVFFSGLKRIVKKAVAMLKQDDK